MNVRPGVEVQRPEKGMELLAKVVRIERADEDDGTFFRAVLKTPSVIGPWRRDRRRSVLALFRELIVKQPNVFFELISDKEGDCEECDGNGKVDAEVHGWIPCAVCDGSGKKP